jgi:hypothetical protein
MRKEKDTVSLSIVVCEALGNGIESSLIMSRTRQITTKKNPNTKIQEKENGRVIYLWSIPIFSSYPRREY